METGLRESNYLPLTQVYHLTVVSLFADLPYDVIISPILC